MQTQTHPDPVLGGGRRLLPRERVRGRLRQRKRRSVLVHQRLCVRGWWVCGFGGLVSYGGGAASGCFSGGWLCITAHTTFIHRYTSTLPNA